MKKRLIVIMGVSGAGKSTVAKALSQKTTWPFLEGDDFHSQANIEKMTGGTPLTDNDRAAWIDAMGDAVNKIEQPTLILSCSALNDFVRERLSHVSQRDIQWVYLQLPRAILWERLQHRTGHFMTSALLDSQLDAMSPPKSAVIIDASPSVTAIVETIQNALNK